MLLVATGHLGRTCGAAKAICVLAISVELRCFECYEDSLPSFQIGW